MILSLCIAGIGGFVGTVSRYLVFMLDKKFYQYYEFPLGTLIVNSLGCFLIGMALGLSMKYQILSRGSYGHFFFVTGFLGAFTTFSTFSQDNLILLMQKHYGFFFWNLALQVGLGLGLTFLGFVLVFREYF